MFSGCDYSDRLLVCRLGFLLEAMVWLDRRMPAAQPERRRSADAYSHREHGTAWRILVEHFGDPGSVLCESARALRPGGRLFVTLRPYCSARTAHLCDQARRSLAPARAEPLLRLRRPGCVPLTFRALRALTSLPPLRESFAGLVVAELGRGS